MTTARHVINQPETFRSQARDLCRAMAAIHRRGWCEGTGGNFSCVISHEPLELLMAPSGVDKGAVRPSELIVVDANRQVLQGHGKVSAEMALHLEIIQTTGAGAVLHTHSQAATLLSHGAIRQHCSRHSDAAERGPQGECVPESASVVIEGLEMLKGLEGIHTHACRVEIPVLANDQNLDRLSQAAHPHLGAAPYGILIAGHGLYAWGNELKQATRHLEILEFLLEQQWRQAVWDALVNRAS